MYPECDCITIPGSCAVLIRETKVHKFCISELTLHENQRESSQGF